MGCLMTELQYLQNAFHLAFLFLEVVIIPLTNSPSCLSITFKHNFIENVYDKKLYDGFNSHLAALAIPGLLLILHAPKAFPYNRIYNHIFWYAYNVYFILAVDQHHSLHGFDNCALLWMLFLFLSPI